MYDTVAYDGIAEVLAALAAAGVRLAVATSKPEPYAAPIVERLGLDHWFETVGGDEKDGSLPTKALVIEKVLHRLGDPHPAEVVMVGDREHDVVGAGVHGIPCIGADGDTACRESSSRQAPARSVHTRAELVSVLLARSGAVTHARSAGPQLARRAFAAVVLSVLGLGFVVLYFLGIGERQARG